MCWPKRTAAGRRRDLNHQRVHVSVYLGVFIPIWIGILVELLTLGNYIDEFAMPAMPALVGGKAVEQRLARGLPRSMSSDV